MRVMWVVFSKEFLDIIRDRRRFVLLLFTTLIVFPIILFAPYAYLIISTAQQSTDTLVIAVQGVDHAPALINYLAEHDIWAMEHEDIATLVREKEYQVGLIIPPDFEEKITTGRSVEIVLITDMRRTMSVRASRLTGVLNEYGNVILRERLGERGLTDDFFTPLTIKKENAATSTETVGAFISLLVPGLVLALGLSSGMPIAIASIAGEKKKLTLEPVLFTTVNRFQLVFAKLLAVLASVFLAFLGLASSSTLMVIVLLVFLMRNLPMDQINLAAGDPGMQTGSLNPFTGGYHLEPVAIILFLLAPSLIILLSAALQILVSTWARNDEEASTYLAPLSFLSSMIFMVAFFLDNFIPQLHHYGIPILGTILSMRDLLSNKVDPASLTVMFGSSGLYALLMVILAVWMFHREEVVFRT